MKRIALFSLILIGVTVFLTAQTASFRQEGIASWYGKEFQDRPTSSGELFNMADFTAAHPTLPFNSMVTVTNKQNNRRVTVRINDRGPFVAARIIDLSMAAAEALDMIGTGTAPVIVESAVSTSLGPVAPTTAATPAETTPQVVVQTPPPQQPAPAATPQVIVQTPPAQQPAPAATPPVIIQAQPAQQPAPAATPPVIIQAQPAQQPAPAAAPPVITPQPPVTARAAPVVYTAPPAVIRGGIPPMGSTKLYRLQVGAFKVPRNAVDVFDRLKAAGLNPRYEQYGDFYRVVLPELRAADIPAIAQTLGNTGFQEVLLREE